jgi:hypothetical protein
MEGSPTGVQQGPRQPHLVESLQEEVVPGAASIDEDSVELDILDDGANCERIPPGFGTMSGWSLQSKVMGTSNHLRCSRVASETVMTSRAVSFCFLFDSYESGPP